MAAKRTPSVNRSQGLPFCRPDSLGDDAEQWLASAKTIPGSWWTHWMRWLKPKGGKQVPARKRLGDARHKPIEPAPGRYVQVRAD
jgi:polyhydroxyalkanoate synthase